MSDYKKLVTSLFFLFFLNNYAEISKVDNLFISAKQNYHSKNYIESLDEFLKIDYIASNSILHKHKYIDYYLGMNYFYLKDYENAVKYLQKAVIIGKKDRDYALGFSFYKIKDYGNAELYLKRYLHSEYSFFDIEKEKEVLNLLTKINPYYLDYYEIKFNRNFKNIERLTSNDLKEICNYFFTEQDYEVCAEYILKILKNKVSYDDKLFFIEKIFSCFLTLEEYDKMNDFIEKISVDIKEEDRDILNKAKGDLYYSKKEFSKSLYMYSIIKNLRYTDEVLLKSASINYALAYYDTALENIKNIKIKNKDAYVIQANAYLRSGEIEKFNQIANYIIENYPESYESQLYSYILQYGKEDFNNKGNLFVTDLVIENYLSNLYDYNLMLLNNSKNLEALKIKDTVLKKDRDLTRLAIEESSFNNLENVENKYFISSIYEMGGLYDLAFQNSLSSKKFFNKYKNLLRFVYPRYYKEIIEKNCFETGVPDYMIYTIINLGSDFQKDLIKANNIGLMQINVLNKKDFEKFLDVEINIEEGTEEVESLLKKFDGNKLKTVLCKLYGEKFLKNIRFDEEDDIDLDSILDLEKRDKIQRVMRVYTFYKKLYQFER